MTQRIEEPTANILYWLAPQQAEDEGRRAFWRLGRLAGIVLGSP